MIDIHQCELDETAEIRESSPSCSTNNIKQPVPFWILAPQFRLEQIHIPEIVSLAL